MTIIRGKRDSTIVIISIIIIINMSTGCYDM